MYEGPTWPLFRNFVGGFTPEAPLDSVPFVGVLLSNLVVLILVCALVTVLGIILAPGETP